MSEVHEPGSLYKGQTSGRIYCYLCAPTGESVVTITVPESLRIPVETVLRTKYEVVANGLLGAAAVLPS